MVSRWTATYKYLVVPSVAEWLWSFTAIDGRLEDRFQPSCELGGGATYHVRDGFNQLPLEVHTRRSSAPWNLECRATATLPEEKQGGLEFGGLS